MKNKISFLALLVAVQLSQPLQAGEASTSSSSCSSSSSSAQNSQLCRYETTQPNQTIFLGLKEEKHHKETDSRNDRRFMTLSDDLQKHIFSFLFAVPAQYLQPNIRSYCIAHKIANTVVALSHKSLLQKSAMHNNLPQVQNLVAMGADPNYADRNINASPMDHAKMTALYGSSKDLDYRKTAYQCYKTLWQADNTINKAPLKPCPTHEEMRQQTMGAWGVRAQFGGTF